MYKIKRFAMTSEEKKERAERRKHDAKRNLAYGSVASLGATVAIPTTTDAILSGIDAKDDIKKLKKSRDEFSKAKEYIRQEIKNGGNRWKGPLGKLQAEADKSALDLLEFKNGLDLKYAKNSRNAAKKSKKAALISGGVTLGAIGAGKIHKHIDEKKRAKK